MIIRDEKTSIPLGHDELASDLAQHIKAMNKPVWENMTLRNCRPDVFTVTPTYNLNQMRSTTYEVKVSRSDFHADVRKQKWESYKAFSSYIFFACPEGLIIEQDIPSGCGLIWRTERGWKQQGTKYNYGVAKMWGGEPSMKDWIKLAIGKWET